jgi:hypothetical protein
VSDWIPPGYNTRAEWIEDLRREALARLSPRQRLARWWFWYWDIALTSAVLAAALAAVWLWALL